MQNSYVQWAVALRLIIVVAGAVKYGSGAADRVVNQVASSWC
jgi:hypothetical protein